MAARNAILALGEVLWDVFPDGPRFGGAPANFACACAELGRHQVDVALASAVGDDELGRKARQHLTGCGVEITHVSTVAAETGQVLVTLDNDGRASYEFIENPAWDHLTTRPDLLEVARSADVVYFGTLGQRAAPSRDAIRSTVRKTPAECLRILDLNLRSPYWTGEVVTESLGLANALKLNDEELPLVAGLLGLSGPTDGVLRTIAARFSFRLIALTRGESGSVLLTADGERSELHGVPVPVVDTVGAGDAFTAALALGLLREMPLDAIHHWATDVATFVCTQPGGTPAMPNRLRLPPH